MAAKDVQAARAKAFDTITKHIERIGQNQSSANAREMRDICMRQFRSEQQNTTKAAALGPIIALFSLQLPFNATEEELKKVGESLRRDYERTAKTPTVKSLILRACAALHANFDVDFKEEDVARDAHPRWLINKALGILDDQIGSADSDDDNVEEAEKGGKYASEKEKKKIDMVLISGALEAIASSIQSVPDKISTSSRTALSKILLKALAPPSHGQRSEVPKSAMKVVECVGSILKKEFIEFAPEIFEKLLELRVCSNKDVTRNAMVSLDAFLITLQDALMDNTLLEESKRIEAMKNMMGKVKELLETKHDQNSNPRKITVAVRALGKLAKPAFYMSSDELEMDLDELMEQLARFTLEEKFAAGGNAFEKRFESMERQVALLIAYTDVLELQQTVDETTLDMVASILRWIFEHYSNEVDTRKRVAHDAIANLFQTLYERGGALRSLFSRCGQSLVLLSLRVGPPDPIDRLLTDAPPIQLWPRYVDLWVRLLGGDEKYERFKPNRASKRYISSGLENKKRSQSLDSAVVSEHLSENSLDEHGMDIDVVMDEQTQIVQGTANVVYDCFVEHILLICNTLELGVRESTMDKPSANLGDESKEKDTRIPEDLVDQNIEANALIALNLEGNLEAKNSADMQTFLGLVDFFRKVIDKSPSKQMCAWIGQLGEELMLLATKNTALSGFYKLIQSSLHAAERSGYFRSVRLDENAQTDRKDYETQQIESDDEEKAARLHVARSFQNFLHEVLAESSGKTGELRAASLSLLLEAPEGLLSLNDLVWPLCSMLELGLQHSPMAETGLKVLETWLTNRREELLPTLPECVRSLRPYLDRGDALSEDLEIDRNRAMTMFDIDENTPSGSVAEWRFEKRMAKQALEQESNSEEKILLMRVLRLLGSVGSYSHFLVNSMEEDEQSGTDQNRDSTILWDSTMRISIDVPLYATEATLWLDSCLPRIAQLAKFSRDRATKVAACEALHAMTLLMVGRNARRPDSTDDRSGITPFHLVYRSLFPVIIDLAADFEPVTSTLFRKLAFQLVRWFTKNQVKEAAETMALLDSITLGVANARFGIKRDLCAALAAEALKWSMKQMMDVQNAVNVKSILRRLYSLMSHPDSNRRLGASSAALRCLELFETQDGSATEILKNHILEMLEVTLRSFRLASFAQSKDAAEDATARLSRLVVRVCKRHARLLMQPSKPARSGTFQTLRDIVMWIFDDGVARPEGRLRLESQYAFCVLYPTCRFDVLRHVEDKGLPYTSDLFDEMKNVNISNINGPSDRGKCDAAIRWLHAKRSAFHFARWSLEVNILPPEIFSQPRHLGIFQNASEYLLLLEDNATLNVGPTALRKWRRAKVDFLVQVLLFVHTSITKLRSSSSEARISEYLALKEIVDNDGFVKVLVKSFLSLESFETEAQEEIRISATAAGILKELSSLVKEYGDNLSPYFGEIYGKVVEELRLGVSKDSIGDLRCVNLSNTSGCSKAARLVTGYRKLFDIQMLRTILPKEEMQSGVIGERLVMVVYNLGKSANPRQKAVGTEILRLAFQLGIEADRIMEIILRDDEWEDGLLFISGRQNTGTASTQRRKKEKNARLEQEKGESFYLSFHKLITNYVVFDFWKYAASILDRAANDVSSPGGRIATHLILAVMTDTGIHARSVLLVFTKRILALDPLVKSDSSRSNDVIARCHRRALAIIERALILDASLKQNRALLHTEVADEKKDQENAAYFIGDALATCLRLDSSSSVRIEAIRISMQTLLQNGEYRNNVCYAIVIEALADLVNHVKSVESDQWDSSGVAEGTKDAILRSFRLSSSKSQLMRIVLPLIEDNYSDQTLKFITKTLTSVENAWDEALAVELFNLAFDNGRESYQKRVCGRLLSIILMNSSSSTVCSFISERVDAIVEILERTNRDESKSDADATNILNAFMIMNGLYQKCSKEQIAEIRPNLQNTTKKQKQKNLNQIVSTRALVEIKGKGASGKSIFDEHKELCLRIRQVCFETFSALLSRTQTKEKIVKFFDTLLQGDPQRFNALIDGNSPCYMEPIWSKNVAPTHNVTQPEGENALPFTMLSSTLLNLDPTLAKTPAEPAERAKNNNANPSLGEDYPRESAESSSQSVRDNLEAFSVSNGFYFLLDIAMQGMQGTSEDPSGNALIGRIILLLKDTQLLPHVRFAIAKAVLRAQRVSIQALNPAKNSNNHESNIEISLFRTIAPNLLSSVVIALIDVSKYCNESTDGPKSNFQRKNIIPSPLREVAVMALECAETWTTETRCVLSNLLCCVIRNSPTGSVVELRENVALGTRLARKLRDCIFSTFDSDTVSEIFYDALREMQSLVKTPSQEETGRLRRIAGVQMIGAFVADGILDITEKKTIVKFNSESQSHDKDWTSDITLTRAVVHHCLMKPDATSGRKCHEAAASLVGVALAKRAEKRIALETSVAGEEAWVRDLSTRLHALKQNKLDVFLIALDRISKHYPPFPYEADFASIVQSSLDKIYGEPRYVALRALSYDTSSSENNIECAKQLLPRMKTFLDSRDPQTHALLMEILARGVLFASSDADNHSGGICNVELLNSESKRLWLTTMNKLDRVFQYSSVVSTKVRAAQTKLCVAVLHAFPEFREEGVVMGPLFRAMADPNEGAGRTAAREHWEKVNHVYTLGERLLDLMKTPPSANAEDSWIKAACALVLAIPEVHQDYEQTVAEDDLADCELTELDINTDWQGSSLPMTPLFSTMSTQVMSSMTFTSSGLPGSGHRFSPRNMVGISQKPAPGLVRATPAAPGTLAIATQQAQAATLVSDVTKRRSEDSRKTITSSTLGTGESGDLPEWLIREQALTGTLQRDPLFGSTLPLVPQVQVAHHQKQTIIDGSSKWPAKQTVSQDYYKRKEENASSLEARRYRALQKHTREQRKHAVHLVRRYRDGELPDVRISRAEILAPLISLAKRDHAISVLLFSALWNATQSEKSRLTIKGTNEPWENAIPGESQQEEARNLLSAFAKSIKGSNVFLASWVLKASADDKESRVSSKDLRRIAFAGDCLAGGIIALESTLMGKKSVALTEGSVGKDVTFTWRAMAALHRAAGDGDAALLSVAKAFDDDEQTHSALKAQLSGDAKKAGKIYRKLKQNNTNTGTVEWRFWTRERTRCAEQLGEWSLAFDEFNEDVKRSIRAKEWRQTSKLLTFGGEELRGVSGEASGGDMSAAAIRISLREPTLNMGEFLDFLHKSGTDKEDKDHARHALLLQDLGVEFAVRTLVNELEDTSKTIVRDVRDRFATRWSSTHPRAVAVRRALLQSLQPCTEIEEVLHCATLSRIPVSSNEVSEFEKGLRNTLSKWQMRWPSTSYDSVEVWERVSSFRCICLEALSQLSTQTSGNLIKQANTDTYWHASRGLRRVGETKLSLKFLQKYGDAIKNSEREKEWKYGKATLKGKILVTRKAEDLESILSMIQNREALEKSFVTAPHISDVKNIEGSVCEKLCMFTKDKHRAETLAHDAITCYSAAESCAEAENNVKLASKASLNLARFCDELLIQYEDSMTRDIDVLSATLVEHVLKAMKSRSKACEKARHLLPRVLAILRNTTGKSAIFSQFESGVRNTPAWYFLDWISELVVLLSSESAYGAVSSLVTRLVEAYPAALRPHFSLGKNTLTLSALKIGEVLLNSPAALQFERAVTLLDFPMARLKWWWKEIELVEHKEGLPTDSKKLSKILNEMLEDVANPDDPTLGPINASFAKLAKPILEEITRSITANTPAISKALQDAVILIEKQWKKFGNDRFESASTLPLERFSPFFSSFEQKSYGGVKEQFMANLEIPGQYDSLSQAPDPTWHAKIVSFETNTTIFTQSKQKPKKIIIRGSDGREYAFIAKGSEDLRQDERIQRLYRAMDSLLTQSPSARAKALRIRTFHVLPLTRRSGLIEFVHRTEPVGRILLNSSDVAKSNIGNISVRHEAFIKARAMLGLSGKKRKEIDGGSLVQEDKMGVTCDLSKVSRPAHDDYLTAMANAELHASNKILRGLSHPGYSPAEDAIRHKLQVASGCPEAFLAARRVFAASLAASSISGWIVGLGDRHCENILLDVSHGSLVHVDFGYAFGTGTLTLPIPEIVPFRATRTFLGALKPLDAREWLETDMARVLTALRSGKNLLEGAMDIFIRDPILDWTRETQKGDDVEKHVEMRVMHARSKLSLANPASICTEQCKPKHSQSAHWEGLQRLILGDDNGARARAGKMCEDVEQQVECLMDMATDPRILANSWTGWKAWM